MRCFRYRFLYSCLVTLVLGVLWSSIALASAFPEAAIQEMRDRVSDQESAYLDLRAELEQLPPDEWSIEQTHCYLDTALWVVYYGMNFYFKDTGRLPSDLEALAGTEYVPTWPGNPFEGWEPIQVLTIGAGFSPGDVTWQICPPEYYSYIRNTRPVSCELSIFGPDIAYGNDLGDAKPHKKNTWAVIPDGAVFMHGQYAEPAADFRKKYEEAERQEEQGNEN